MTLRFLDIHSHLNDTRYDADRNDVIDRMHIAEVGTIVVGTDEQMSKKAIELADTHNDIWATIGQHPTDIHGKIADYTIYRTMAEHQRVVAIGECGLDYFWPANEGWKGGEKKEKERQRELFAQQIKLAASVDKPLMIHARPNKGTFDAYIDILAMIREAKNKYGERVRGNAHFFAGDIALARQFFDLGFTISFTGVLTFVNEYDDVVRYAPLSSLMAETDAPYVSPAPYRRERNEPVRVIEVVKAIARIRGEQDAVVAFQCLETAKRIFFTA